MAEDKVKYSTRVYNYLRKKTSYNDSEGEFDNTITNAGNARKVYDLMVSEGAIMPDFDTFRANLAGRQKQTQATPNDNTMPEILDSNPVLSNDKRTHVKTFEQIGDSLKRIIHIFQVCMIHHPFFAIPYNLQKINYSNLNIMFVLPILQLSNYLFYCDARLTFNV